MQPKFYSETQGSDSYLSQEVIARKLEELHQQLIFRVLQTQFLLTQNLMEGQGRLSEELGKQRRSSDFSNSSRANSQNERNKASNEEEKQRNFDSQKYSSSGQKNKELPASRLRIKKKFRYDMDSESQISLKEVKKCETKNIIKNFFRSMATFIKKKLHLAAKICSQYHVDEQEFKRMTQSLQGKINTISELRLLWTENKYCMVFRAVSEYFLKRYYTKHIFNSRVLNYNIHLKYRQKLLSSVQHPNQFISLKDF